MRWQPPHRGPWPQRRRLRGKTKWPCTKCLYRLDRAKRLLGRGLPELPPLEGGRRKPYKLERAEDKLRIAKWRREKCLVE